MKPLSWPSQFILWQQRAVKTYFQENSLSHKCFTLVFKRDSVAVAATVYQEHHFWPWLRTEGQELFAFWILACNTWSFSMQQIQFLKFMGELACILLLIRSNALSTRISVTPFSLAVSLIATLNKKTDCSTKLSLACILHGYSMIFQPLIPRLG